MKVRISIKFESDLENGRIGLIKEFRQITSCGLKEAVDFVNGYSGPAEIELLSCNTTNLMYWNVEIVPTYSPVEKETSVDRFKALVKDLIDEENYSLAVDLILVIKNHKL